MTTTMRFETSPVRRRRLCLAAATILNFAIPGTILAVPLQEPSTVFYGRVVGTGSPQPFVMTDGELRWTIRRPDGTLLPLRTRLWALQDGAFSYRLDVPHEALALGLTVSPEALPLKTVGETNAIVEIQVNGVSARIAGPGSGSFQTAQSLRAATHRLDLEVPIAAPDSDGDGLPDWWEKQYGGDLTPNGDPDHDGLTNLSEYRAGSNPRQDSRRPTVTTAEIRAYADLTNGVFLRAQDCDTDPAALVYTITRTPAGAELRLRNSRPSPAQPDVALAAGATLTQGDVLGGRLVLVQTDPEVTDTSFEVTLNDGTLGIEATPAPIKISFYRPSSELIAWFSVLSPGAAPGDFDPASEEARRARIYVLGRNRGAVVRDAASESDDLNLSTPSSSLSAGRYAEEYLPRFGADRPQLLAGGRGDDTLTGGVADDVLIGGAGDNHLTGGRGADRFLVQGGEHGADVIADFNPDEGDVLDVESCLNGVSHNLRDYIRVAAAPAGSRLELDFNGDGSGYSDRTVELVGLPPERVDLYDLLDRGSLVAGSLVLPPRIAVAASRSEAAENGPRSGEFLVSRSGSLAQRLTVSLSVRGSAANGIDFATLPSVVTFEAGQREIRIPVEPYADSVAEPSETVELSVEAGSGYEIAPAGRAQVSIADLRPVVRIEALDPLATTQPIVPASLLVSRDTVIDRSVLIRLDLQGSAANGTDYQTVSRYLNLTPGQATALITITPTLSAVGSADAKSVRISVVPDPAYLVDGPGLAEILLVPERTTLAAWRARFFPSSPGSLVEFGGADPGATGIPNALRYAFGMDPLHPDPSRMPRLVVRDGHLTLDVWRRPGAEDVDLVAEASTDLASWSAASDRIERVVVPEHARNPEVVSFRAVGPIDETPHLFLNLRVVLRP